MSYGEPPTELQKKELLEELKLPQGFGSDEGQNEVGERQWIEEEKQQLSDWRMRLCLPLLGFGMFVQIIGFESVRRHQENSAEGSGDFLSSFTFPTIFCIGFGLALFAIAVMVFVKNSKRIRQLQERLDAMG
ncbi:MAG: hypothetical protein ACQKBT_04730 [Puniceicoccales bacterium]